MTENEWGVETEWIEKWKEHPFEEHFFNGIEEGYPLCCILFFCMEWDRLQHKIPELSDPLVPLTIMHNNQRVMCPRCIMEYFGDIE